MTPKFHQCSCTELWMWLLTGEMVALEGLWFAKMTAIVPAIPNVHLYVGLPILPWGGEVYFNTTGIWISLVTYFYQWNAAEVTCLTSEVGPYEVYSICFCFLGTLPRDCHRRTLLLPPGGSEATWRWERRCSWQRAPAARHSSKHHGPSTQCEQQYVPCNGTLWAESIHAQFCVLT